jgi:hypothetical protein
MLAGSKTADLKRVFLETERKDVTPYALVHEQGL